MIRTWSVEQITVTPVWGAGQRLAVRAVANRNPSRIDVDRYACSQADGADLDVAVADAPGLPVGFGIAAAGELGHDGH